ncbi:isochorismatase [Motilimonas cestriensis]|uniref:isochorismatase n=1 Tax=Motilimonas cestriensis TaxID=2742685 RepID=A0ABS8WH04_9GAMM|nr:isochorismatase [Motilimonas cestriensis]MCE2597003.1 isochorismatase [Motilimonas cestriensis]
MAITALSAYPLPRIEDFPTNKVSWTFDPSQAVFLIHDMQEYFVSFYGAENALIDEVIANLVSIKAYCKANGIPVVYTAQPKEQNIADRGLLTDMWGPGINQSPEQQEVVSALAPEPEDTVLDKWRYSAFQRAPLEQIMKELGRNQLLIGGIYGHIGCLMTAVDAFMRDIKPFMVGDAVADFSRDDHDMALKYVATRCGQVVTTASVTEQATPAINQAANATNETTNGAESPITKATLQGTILSLIDEPEDEFDADENLLDYGLDSVHVMSLLTQWRKQGIELNFVALANEPTLNNWWQLISAQQEAQI